MTMKITQQREVPLLKRKELVCDIPYDTKVTPKKEDVAKKISEAMKTDASKISIKIIQPLFGEHRARVIAYVYETEDDLKKCEVIKKKQKKAETPAPAQ